MQELTHVVRRTPWEEIKAKGGIGGGGGETPEYRRIRRELAEARERLGTLQASLEKAKKERDMFRALYAKEYNRHVHERLRRRLNGSP